MVRILHVLDHSLPLHSGYTFRTRAIMKAQIAAGWDARGLTGLRQYQHGQQPGPCEEEAEGLHFYRTPTHQSGVPLLRELREVRALEKRILALYREWPFDLVHAHSPALNGLAAARAAQKLGLPLVYEIRAFWEDAAVGNGTGREGSARYLLTRALENHVIARANHIAVICEGLRGDLVARGVAPDRILVSPNGVDMAMFGDPPPRDATLATELGLQGKQVIGYIGSFYDYEGLDDLIDMMVRLKGPASAAHLLLVGGGPTEDALRRQVAASPVAERIHFVGRVPHDQVQRYYSLIDVLVYPRKSMRLTDLVTPLKPLEAMAQGRLVAASDVGGHKELIADGVTGTLFPADNPAGAAKVIDALFAERAAWDQRKANARAFVEKERNWQNNIMRYEPVYHLLLAEGKRG